MHRPVLEEEGGDAVGERQADRSAAEDEEGYPPTCPLARLEAVLDCPGSRRSCHRHDDPWPWDHRRRGRASRHATPRNLPCREELRSPQRDDRDRHPAEDVDERVIERFRHGARRRGRHHAVPILLLAEHCCDHRSRRQAELHLRPDTLKPRVRRCCQRNLAAQAVTHVTTCEREWRQWRRHHTQVELQRGD